VVVGIVPATRVTALAAGAAGAVAWAARTTFTGLAAALREMVVIETLQLGGQTVIGACGADILITRLKLGVFTES
jgi:hypothetical protein